MNPRVVSKRVRIRWLKSRKSERVWIGGLDIVLWIRMRYVLDVWIRGGVRLMDGWIDVVWWMLLMGP